MQLIIWVHFNEYYCFRFFKIAFAVEVIITFINCYPVLTTQSGTFHSFESRFIIKFSTYNFGSSTQQLSNACLLETY